MEGWTWPSKIRGEAVALLPTAADGPEVAMRSICVRKMAETWKSMQDQAQSPGKSDLAVSFIVQLLLSVCLKADFSLSLLWGWEGEGTVFSLLLL